MSYQTALDAFTGSPTFGNELAQASVHIEMGIVTYVSLKEDGKYRLEKRTESISRTTKKRVALRVPTYDVPSDILQGDDADQIFVLTEEYFVEHDYINNASVTLQRALEKETVKA